MAWYLNNLTEVLLCVTIEYSLAETSLQEENVAFGGEQWLNFVVRSFLTETHNSWSVYYLPIYS